MPVFLLNCPTSTCFSFRALGRHRVASLAVVVLLGYKIEMPINDAFTLAVRPALDCKFPSVRRGAARERRRKLSAATIGWRACKWALRACWGVNCCNKAYTSTQSGKVPISADTQ